MTCREVTAPGNKRRCCICREVMEGASGAHSPTGRVPYPKLWVRTSRCQYSGHMRRSGRSDSTSGRPE